MSALYAVETVLDPQYLSESLTKVAKGTLQNPMLDFYETSPSNEDGDKIEIDIFSDDRQAAAVQKRGAPARSQDARGVDSMWVSPIHSFNDVTIPLESVQHLRNPSDPGVDAKGMKEINRQFELQGRRQRMLRAAALSKVLSAGILYFDADGQILESSSGAKLTIDLQVGATHKSQLAHASNGSSDIINIAWDQSTALIFDDLEQISEAAEYDMAPEPTDVWLHTCAKQWLRSNADFIKFLTNQGSAQADLFIQGMAVDQFTVGKWTFHFMNHTYVGADGVTPRPMVPKTKAIITPKPNNGTWFRCMNGAMPVPKQIGVFSSIQEALNNVDTVYGMFAYCALVHNVPGLSLLMGDNFFYAFADRNAIWMPTVDF